MRRLNAIERYTATYIPEPNSGCWLWLGSTCSEKRGGYGVFIVNNKRVYVHRFAYETFRGPIPEGLVIDHKCNNPLCVNPWHLEPTTIRGNIERGKKSNRRRNNCRHGHPLSGYNLILAGKDKDRVCRECKNERVKQWRYKHYAVAQDKTKKCSSCSRVLPIAMFKGGELASTFTLCVECRDRRCVKRGRVA